MTALLSRAEQEALLVRVRVRLDEEEARRSQAGRSTLTQDAARAFAAASITAELREWESLQVQTALPPDPRAVESEIRRLVEAGFGMGGLEPLLADPDVEEIWVNGCDNVHVRYADGRRRRAAAVCGSDEELVTMIQMTAARAGRTERTWSTATPFLDLRLPDGSRLNAVREVSERPTLTIRRQRHRQVDLSDLVALGTMSPIAGEFLRAAVRARLNVVIAGGTSTGKTTFLRALLNEVGPHERLVTVEDTLELHLSDDPERHPNVVELETRPANSSGQGKVTLEDLCRNALRMAPDRLIVGEVRGGEAVDMLSAMSAGMDGSACTIHADSAAQAPAKVAVYCQRAADPLPVEASLRLFAMSVDLVVHLRMIERPGEAPIRRVTEIIEITHYDEGVKSNRVFAQPEWHQASESTGHLSDALRRRLAGVDFDSASLSPVGVR